MTSTIPTHQETITAAAKTRTAALIATAAPTGARRVTALREKAAELAAQVEQAEQEFSGVMVWIESLVNRQNQIGSEVEQLHALAALAANHAANAKQALVYFLAQGRDPYSARNWAAACEEMNRAAIVAPAIPGVIAELEAERDASTAEVERLSGENKISVPALLAELKRQRIAPTTHIHNVGR